MIKLNSTDLEIAQLRKLRFSVKVKGAPEQNWSAIYKNLEIREAFARVENICNEYHEKGVFLECESGPLKYWSNASGDLFNSVVLLV